MTQLDLLKPDIFVAMPHKNFWTGSARRFYPQDPRPGLVMAKQRNENLEKSRDENYSIYYEIYYF